VWTRIGKLTAGQDELFGVGPAHCAFCRYHGSALVVRQRSGLHPAKPVIEARQTALFEKLQVSDAWKVTNGDPKVVIGVVARGEAVEVRVFLVETPDTSARTSWTRTLPCSPPQPRTLSSWAASGSRPTW